MSIQIHVDDLISANWQKIHHHHHPFKMHGMGGLFFFSGAAVEEWMAGVHPGSQLKIPHRLIWYC